jgi:hypothetical protein
MNQPDILNDGSNKVCRLLKAIYGLKQAGRVWNAKLNKILKNMGLIKCKLDPCIFYDITRSMILGIYVDDLLILYREERSLKGFKESIQKTIKIKDIGPAKNCIGMSINQGVGFIEIDQCSYVSDILSRFKMDDCKPVHNPCNTSEKLSIKCLEVEDNLTGTVPYQEVVGSVLYLTQCTRPDIGFSVNDVSRFNQKHGNSHWTAVKRILRYLKGTANYKFRFERSDEEISAYCDSDWGSDIDKRRSCSGYTIKYGSTPVIWNSKRQRIVALSSTEAEYIALSSCTCDTLWVIQFVTELTNKKPGPAIIHIDNQSSIKLAQNDAFQQRTKHIDIRYHHVREHIERGVIKINYIPTAENEADALTKPVTCDKLNLCRDFVHH